MSLKLKNIIVITIYSTILVTTHHVLRAYLAYQLQNVMAAISNALSIAFNESGIGSMTISIRMASAWVPGGGGSNMVVNWMRTELSNARQPAARAKHKDQE
jgi:hypothetical protein